MNNGQYLSADVQARIEPPPIPLINFEFKDERSIHIIKVRMRRNPTSAVSCTFNINMSTFDDGQPEEFLALLKNSRIEIYGTVITSPSGRINYLSMMLCEQVLRELDELVSQNNGSTNGHLRILQRVYLGISSQLTIFTRRSVPWGARCINLEAWRSIVFLHN